jgi:TIR domain-containing protein
VSQQRSICVLCGQHLDSEAAKQICSFHPGTPSFVFSTGADTRDYQMGYRDIYVWSCCGKREPSRIVGANEILPLPSPGCISHPNHRAKASACIVFADQWEGFCRASQASLSERGIETEFINVESLALSKIDTDCLAFVLGDPRHEQAMTIADDLRKANPNLPMVIFSDPDRIDGWRLQASNSAGLTENQFTTAIFDAVRSRYTLEDGWIPRLFFSYSRTDDQKMSELVHSLSRMERACWVDKHILAPGIDWSWEIDRAIARSDLFVMLLTKNTPLTTYCWNELAVARASKKPVFVIAYDNAELKLKNAPSEKDRALAPHSISYESAGGPSEARTLVASTNETPPDTTIFRATSQDYSGFLREIWWMHSFLQGWPRTWQIAESSR